MTRVAMVMVVIVFTKFSSTNHVHCFGVSGLTSSKTVSACFPDVTHRNLSFHAGVAAFREPQIIFRNEERRRAPTRTEVRPSGACALQSLELSG